MLYGRIGHHHISWRRCTSAISDLIILDSLVGLLNFSGWIQLRYPADFQAVPAISNCQRSVGQIYLAFNETQASAGFLRVATILERKLS